MPSLQKWRELKQRVAAVEATQAVLTVQMVSAEKWLEEALSGGPQPVVSLKQAATAAGITDWGLWRAKVLLGVRSKRRGFQGPFQWSLPP